MLIAFWMNSQANQISNQSYHLIAIVIAMLTHDDVSNRDEKKKIYMTVLTTFSAREQFWLARVILKDMKMGVRHESMLKLYHPKATDIFNASSSLARGITHPSFAAAAVWVPFALILCVIHIHHAHSM
jgi:hypothetical protein